MPGIAYTSIGDLIVGTLNELPKTFTDTMRQVEYPLSRLFFSQYKKRTGGVGYEKKIRKAPKTTFQRTLPYQATSTQHEDLLVAQTTPWVFFEQKMEYDDRTMRMNSGGQEIIDMMKAERSGAYEDIFNNLEDDLVRAPDNTSDRRHPYGLDYWFPTLELNTADATGGFNGKTIQWKDGSTPTTTRAGVDLSLAANARLRSFVGTYSGYTDEAFFDLLRRAMTRTNFGTLAQLEGDKPAGSSPGDMYILANHDICDQLAKRVNKGPDDQGGDTERFKDGQFRGVGFMRSPAFDSLSYAPIYGIKRSKTFGLVLGEWMKEIPAQNSQATLRTYVIGIVGDYNLTCDDPRSGGFCIHTVRTAA